MKKIFLFVVALVAFVGVKAESYNALSIVYDNTQFWSKLNPHFEHPYHYLNGVGLQYNYGISLGDRPMNIEVGAKVVADFWGSTETIIESDYKERLFMLRVSVPVSYIYHIPIRENFYISPYAGVDFKCNALATQTEIDPWDVHHSVNMFNKDKVGEDYVWNRFQAGWHVGLRLSYRDFFASADYGTDIIPIWSHNICGDKYRLNTGDFSFSVGYCFK